MIPATGSSQSQPHTLYTLGGCFKAEGEGRVRVVSVSKSEEILPKIGIAAGQILTEMNGTPLTGGGEPLLELFRALLWKRAFPPATSALPGPAPAPGKFSPAPPSDVGIARALLTSITQDLQKQQREQGSCDLGMLRTALSTQCALADAVTQGMPAQDRQNLFDVVAMRDLPSDKIAEQVDREVARLEQPGTRPEEISAHEADLMRLLVGLNLKRS